jgi:ATP-binding cassette subfamily B multidrug efflux pump
LGQKGLIIHACDLTDTIAAMPDKIQTLVGERGITLSGGQKQRMALARTLILEKKIIILDDPVSHLDTQTAQTVISRLSAMNQNATLIIISHRISALASCDNIYILDKGQISGQGCHEDLIASNEFYRDAFQVQQFEEAHES